jgi:hypothetical protein
MLASGGGKTRQAIQRNFALKRNGIGERANAPYPFTFNLPAKKGNKMQKKNSTMQWNGGVR